MNRLRLAALLALLGACAPQRDVAPPGERFGGRTTHPAAAAAPTVYAVLGHREQLGLSSAQVSAIDSIGGWLQARNEPLLDSLRLRDDGRSRLPRESADAVMEAIRANQRAAVDGVAAALTAEQRARVCQLFAEQRGERGRRSRGSRPSLARRARGSARDTLPGGPRARWGWCAPQAAARRSAPTS